MHLCPCKSIIYQQNLSGFSVCTISSLMPRDAAFLLCHTCSLPYITLHKLLFLSIFNCSKGSVSATHLAQSSKPQTKASRHLFKEIYRTQAILQIKNLNAYIFQCSFQQQTLSQRLLENAKPLLSQQDTESHQPPQAGKIAATNMLNLQKEQIKILNVSNSGWPQISVKRSLKLTFLPEVLRNYSCQHFLTRTKFHQTAFTPASGWPAESTCAAFNFMHICLLEQCLLYEKELICTPGLNN